MNRVISTKQFLFRQIEVPKATFQWVCVLRLNFCCSLPHVPLFPHITAHTEANLSLTQSCLSITWLIPLCQLGTGLPSALVSWLSSASVETLTCTSLLCTFYDFHKLSLWILILFYISPWVPCLNWRLSTARQMDYLIAQTRFYYLFCARSTNKTYK